MHESFDRQYPVRPASDRKFGFVMAGALAVVGLLPILRGRPPRVWALGLSVMFAVLALARPTALAAVNRAWTRLGLLLQRVTSPILLGVVFFLVVTPIALVLRLIGKKTLDLSFDRTAASYWTVRAPETDPTSMTRQF